MPGQSCPRIPPDGGQVPLGCPQSTDSRVTEYLSQNPIAPDQPGSVTARAARERHTIHVADTRQDPEYGVGPITFSNDRSVLSVPLVCEEIVIGVVTVGRLAVMPFTDKQIDLIETFADQAVIAIENARLFEEVQARTRELTEALEQQTATSEVLSVISSSPGDLEPVFQAMLQNATRICEANFALLLRERAMHFALLRCTACRRCSPRSGDVTRCCRQIPKLPSGA